MKLNQIIAVLTGKKPRCERGITDIYQTLSQTAAFNGVVRTYQPKDDDGDKLPNEENRVKATVGESVEVLTELLGELIDAAATQEYGNTAAKADIAIDGQVIVPAVPVTAILFLEKQLINVATFVSKLPTLTNDTTWEQDPGTGLHRSRPVQTVKTKKVPKVQVLYEATDKHPAQVQAYNEDIVVGTWTTTHLSGAISEAEKKNLLAKVVKLQEAVKAAREEANSVEIDQVKIASKLLGYVFG